VQVTVNGLLEYPGGRRGKRGARCFTINRRPRRHPDCSTDILAAPSGSIPGALRGRPCRRLPVVVLHGFGAVTIDRQRRRAPSPLFDDSAHSNRDDRAVPAGVPFSGLVPGLVASTRSTSWYQTARLRGCRAVVISIGGRTSNTVWWQLSHPQSLPPRTQLRESKLRQRRAGLTVALKARILSKAKTLANFGPGSA